MSSIGVINHVSRSHFHRKSVDAGSSPTPTAAYQHAVKKYGPWLNALSTRGVKGFEFGNLPDQKGNKTGIRILVESQGDKERLSGFIADNLDRVPVGFVVVGKPGMESRRPTRDSDSNWAQIPEDHAKVMDKYSDDVMALTSVGVNGFGYGILPDKDGNLPDLGKYAGTNEKPPLGIVIFTETKKAGNVLRGFMHKSLDGVPTGIQFVGKIVAY